jgi:ribosomal protein S18 acetylase RimI-like enzyme
VIRRWQPGWGLCRGLPPAEEIDGALRVRHGLPGRAYEIVALDDTSVDRLARTLDDETWLTVPTNDPESVVIALKNAGLQLAGEPERLMTTDLRDHPVRTADPPATTRTENGVIHAEIGAAASGMMGVVGTDAVAHDIRTDPAFRRRGLASVVMSALALAAVEAGATTGLLIASAAGEHLYRSLGWAPVATILSARRLKGN